MAASPAAPRDSLLFFTDLHFWEVQWNPLRLLNKRILGNANVILKRRHHFPMQNAGPHADHALSLGPRTVILGGDLTSTATDGEFRMVRQFIESLEAKGATVLTVVGNHDVYTYESLRKARFQTHLGPWLPGPGFPCWRPLPGGTPALFLPTSVPNLLTAKGRITAEEVEQTEALLDEIPDGPVIAFAHYPALHETETYSSSVGRQLRGAAELRRVLGDSGRDILYVAGHVHKFSRTRDPEYPRVLHVTSPAFFNHWKPAGRYGGFLEIHCGDEGFEVVHHFRDAEWRRETVSFPDPASCG